MPTVSGIHTDGTDLLVGRCYGQLRSIRTCRRALTVDTQCSIRAFTTVNSFIVSDSHYNSLLAGCSQQQLDKLQRVLNCAARVIYGGRRGDHVTALLCDNLHWLRIRERMTFKLSAGVQGHTLPRTILNRCHVHPGRHHVNTTIAKLGRLRRPPGAKEASQVRQPASTAFAVTGPEA